MGTFYNRLNQYKAKYAMLNIHYNFENQILANLRKQ